jgi:hypothetical protein
MNQNTWSTDERAEYDELCREAWESAVSTRDRTEEFLRLLHDADQAHRLFARDVLRDAEQRGAASIIKAWFKRSQRIAVSYQGEVLTKTRVVGAQAIGDDGQAYVVQTLFDLLTFDQIAAKLEWYRRQRQAYTANIHVCERLLLLQKLAPGASTPAEACELVGTTVDAFLAA